MQRRLQTRFFPLWVKRPLILHPMLFAIYPALFLYSINLWQTDLQVLWFPLTLVLYSALVLWTVFLRIFPKRLLAGLLTSWSIFIFFSYGHLHGALLNRGIVVGYHRTLLPLWFLVFGAGVFLLFRLRRYWRPMTFLLNLVSAFLVSETLINIGKWMYVELRQTDIQMGRVSEVVLKQAKSSPDIYYIILDGYMRHDTLESVLGYDNRPFLDFLKERGFYIAENSRSNYPYTSFSLASSLNVSYVNFLSRAVGESSKDFTVTYPLIQSNEVARLLKTVGYRYVQVGTSWSVTNYSPLADKTISFLSVSDTDQFINLFLKTSLLAVFMGDAEDISRATTLYAFEQIPLAGDDGQATFIFAHIVAPHPPYVFDAQGGKVDIPEKGWDTQGTKHAYLEQLKFVNHKIEELVSKLLSQPDQPIIILQADHGWAWAVGWDLYPYSPVDQHFDFDQVFGIFNAYYFPGQEKVNLYPSISPVNTFRTIFNQYFGTSLRLLADESYYSDYYDSPYQFQNVTEQLSQ